MKAFQSVSVLCVLMAIGGVAEQAHAKCPGKIDLEQTTLQSDAVVFGKVAELEPEGETTWRAELEVEKTYKGKIKEGSTIEVSSPQGEDEVDWQAGQQVIVYLNKSTGSWATSKCVGSKPVEVQPLAAETSKFFPVKPADAPLELKARRASAIFTGEVVAAGRGYAGRWDGVMIEVKVKDAIKGTKRNKKIKLRLDEDSCSGGKKRNLLSDDDLLAGDLEAPFKEKESYLFFAYDEAPHQVMLCHENMAPLASASDDVSMLKTMCKKGRCQSGHDAVTSLRKKIKAGVESNTINSLKTCAKQFPLYSKDGAITDLSLHVRIQPAGKVELLNVESKGTLQDGSLYGKLGQCMQQQLEQWSIYEQDGRPDLEAKVELQMKEASRGPKVERSDVLLFGR